ncbi:MAG: serine protein kinase PrkA, partial [Desulfotignum balticum]|nr:serine protein kinase PrkA [Desulfotignum balticum]
MAAKIKGNALLEHVDAVKKGKRAFEDAFQGVSRMILDAGIQKITVKGKSTYQFNLFSQGKKHLVGMYDEINAFVSFVKDASEGGSSREMAFVLVGEPGNGKTFFVDYLCDRYREFLSIPDNQ